MSSNLRSSQHLHSGTLEDYQLSRKGAEEKLDIVVQQLLKSNGLSKIEKEIGNNEGTLLKSRSLGWLEAYVTRYMSQGFEV